MNQSDVSKQDIKDYLAKSTVSAFLRKLLQDKKERNLAELLGYATAIESAFALAGHSSGFLDYFKKFKTLKANVAFRVWATPAAYHWNAMIRMLVDASIYQTGSSHILKHYLEFLNLDLEQGLVAHLNDFGRFVLSAFVLAQDEVRFDVPVLIRLPNTLPGTGLALCGSDADIDTNKTIRLSALNQTSIGRLIALQNSAGNQPVVITLDDERYGEVTAWKMPRWRGTHGYITIDSFEPCLNLPYVEIYPRVQAPERSEQFLRTVVAALDRLAEYDPGLVDEISLITASVTPMDATATSAEMCSGTSSAIFGGCFLSLTNETLYMAEMLLHEFCHNKLRLFEDFFPLLSPESLNRPQFYSPWRDDPRPLEGIQHGLFVFGSIARFWLSVCKDPKATQRERTLAQRRVGTLLYQLQYARGEFSQHAQLTDHGRAFLDEMNDWINGLEEQTRSWDLQGMLPFFSGVLKDKSLKEIPIPQAMPQHRSNWERLYRAGNHG